jgi:hypothetical protein
MSSRLVYPPGNSKWDFPARPRLTVDRPWRFSFFRPVNKSGFEDRPRLVSSSKHLHGIWRVIVRSAQCECEWHFHKHQRRRLGISRGSTLRVNFGSTNLEEHCCYQPSPPSGNFRASRSSALFGRHTLADSSISATANPSNYAIRPI